MNDSERPTHLQATEQPDSGVAPPPPVGEEVAMDASRALGEPVSYLSGDRFCGQCNHNLVGQPVYRERAYGIIVARCPECGRFAPLQEYPSLGRWGRRLGACVAAIVILVVLLFMASSAGVLAAMSYGVAMSSQSRVATTVRARVQEFAAEPQMWWRDPTIYDAWVAETGGVPTVIRDLGGRPRALSPEVVPVGLGLFVLAFVLAGLVAVMVPGQRGIKLILIAMIPPLLSVLYLTPWWSQLIGPLTRLRGLARLNQEVEFYVAVPAYIVAWVVVLVPATVAGTLLGRTIARGVVCMILPKRHRVALSFLWQCDGRRPPAVH